MSAIITKFVRENNLSPEMSLGELSQHAPELLELLTDKVKRDQARQRLLNGYKFSRMQASAMVPFLKGGRPKDRDAIPPSETTDTLLEGGAVNVYQISQEETIRELAQRIVQENLSEMKVRDIARALVETASNATSGVSRLSRLRKELHNLKASEKSISATFDPETTRLSNNMQKEHRLQ
ncbi:hypothetical protein C1646_764046, partial [Rhizophagus diaphanus]